MIAFDSQTLMFGVQASGHQGREGLAERARKYIRHLDEQGELVMVPAPALAEYLAGFPVEEHEAQLRVIQKRFIVPALDVGAARIAGELLANRPHIKNLRATDYKGERQRVSVDALVLAVAIANNAVKIISNDKRLPKLAAGRIQVEEIPEVPIREDFMEP